MLVVVRSVLHVNHTLGVRVPERVQCRSRAGRSTISAAYACSYTHARIHMEEEAAGEGARAIPPPAPPRASTYVYAVFSRILRPEHTMHRSVHRADVQHGGVQYGGVQYGSVCTDP